MRLDIGQLAPTFRLQNQDQNWISSEDLLGKRYLLYFYPQDDTPGCTLESQQFQQLSPELDSLEVTIFGVSPDSCQSHIEFRRKYSLEFDLLSDPSHEVLEAYGAWGEKNTYGKITKGVIRSTVLIDKEGRVEYAWYNVKADGHPGRVLLNVRP